MKIAKFAFAAAFLLAAAHQAHSQTLLSYWNFNNVNPAYNSGAGTLGSFSTTAASYGETYSSNTLSSNTSGTTYNGANIYLDFSNLTSSTVNNAIVNGKAASGGQAQTNTVFGGYGTFADTTINRAAGDTTTGGALIIMNPSGTEVGHYLTLSLSSTGFESLSLSFATRLANGFAGQEVWTYSLNGIDYLPLTSISPTANGNFQSASLNLSTLSSGALDNQSSFYLRMTINSSANGGSYAFDNLQLTGTAVPEPATSALLLGGFSVTVLFLRRARKNA